MTMPDNGEASNPRPVEFLTGEIASRSAPTAPAPPSERSDSCTGGVPSASACREKQVPGAAQQTRSRCYATAKHRRSICALRRSRSRRRIRYPQTPCGGRGPVRRLLERLSPKSREGCRPHSLREALARCRAVGPHVVGHRRAGVEPLVDEGRRAVHPASVDLAQRGPMAGR